MLKLSGVLGSSGEADGDLSLSAVFAVPVLLCAAMLAIAAATTVMAGVDARGLLQPYLSGSISVTIIAFLIFIWVKVAQLARAKAEAPLRTVASELRERCPLLILPAFLFPLFLSAYTAAKTSIPFLVGYSWDGVWVAGDRLIFRIDPWRITHALFSASTMRAWEFLYSYVWAAALTLSAALVPLFASRRTTAVFYSAMMGTWLLGGCLMAYAFSSAGPIFLDVVDPSAAAPFQSLKDLLDKQLSPQGVRTTQDYLAAALHSTTAVKGGGISAMPSMHLGACAIYVTAARGTKWLIPAIALWLLVFIASAHLGYHYWVDGLVAAAVAWLCWRAAKYLYSARLQAPEVVVRQADAAEPA